MDRDEAPATRHDRLKQLRAFCETVRLGSLSGAAKALGTSQPAVSKQVQTLEDVLGATLFRRAGPRIAPTRVGENLFRVALPLVEGLLRLPELFEERHSGVAAGALRIGAGEVSGGYVLPGLVKRFHARHPDILVTVRTGSGVERLEWLRTFELDVVVAAINDVYSDLECYPLVRTDAVVVVPEGHPLAESGGVAIAALADAPLIAPSAGSYARQIQDVVLHLHGVRPNVVIEVEGWGSMLNHVAAGSGIAVVPSVCVSPHERVRTVRLNQRVAPRTYGVVVRRDRLMTLAASRFLRLVTPGTPGGGETP